MNKLKTDYPCNMAYVFVTIIFPFMHKINFAKMVECHFNNLKQQLVL